MTITKEYALLIENGLLRISISKGLGKVTDNPNWFESDNLQDCIDEILNNDIENFDLPLEITRPDNVPTYYQNPVFSDNILTKYEDGLPVFEEHILTSFEEMTEEEKENRGFINKIAFLKWVEYKDGKAKYVKRFHFLLKDALPEGLLESKTTEMLIKKNPFYRVNSNHVLDNDAGIWIDLYLKEIKSSDMPLIESYLTTVPGSSLEDFLELDN